MYTTTLALSYAFYPSRSGSKHFPSSTSLSYTPTHRTTIATFVFALGALLGWPFSLVLALPFVVEEVFVPSGLLVSRTRYASLVLTRLINWSQAVLTAAWTALPLLIIDTLAYARLTLVPLNIVVYNILSAKRGAGPELYGVEPWYYYMLNLALNFGPALPLALLSLPAVLFTAWYEPKRFAAVDASTDAHKGHTGPDRPQASSGSSLLVLRLAPLYLWLGLLTLQPHKEERFMFPAYPLLCFNAAVCLSLARGWMERWYTDATKSPYRASKSYLFTAITSATLGVATIFGLSRILHTAQSYHAPVSLLNHFGHHELSRVVANIFPSEQSVVVQARMASGLAPVWTEGEQANMSKTRQYESSGVEKEVPQVDLRPLTRFPYGGDGGESLRLCYAKEWFRFPSTYLVPDGVAVDFVKSDFQGILPKHFLRQNDGYEHIPGLDEWLGWLWPWRGMTRPVRESFNDMNREEWDQYVELSTCDYLIDVDYPHRSESPSPLEPRHVRDAEQWTQVKCVPFLDGPGSQARPGAPLAEKARATLDRVLWLPEQLRGSTNRYGDYCLLRTTRQTSLANTRG